MMQAEILEGCFQQIEVVEVCGISASAEEYIRYVNDAEVHKARVMDFKAYREY